MDIIMECKNVDYSYPLTTEPAIKHLNLQIERGKFYGVIGENGSGKTTLCALLRGFAPSFYKGEIKGEVLVEGKNINEYGGELSQKIGFVFKIHSRKLAELRILYLKKLPMDLKTLVFR